MSAWRSRFERFFFSPASARPLAALRIWTCAVLLLQAALLLPDLHDLYGSQGILQGTLNEFFISPSTPQLRWFERAFAAIGVPEAHAIEIVFLFYVASVATLLLGFATRIAAGVAWFLHFALIYSTGTLSSYGVDSMAHMTLFYFIFMPAGGAWSLDRRWRRGPASAGDLNRLALRVLQIHLCALYLIAGVAKAQGIQWWNGEAIWRASMLPQFANVEMSWLASWPWVAKIAGWGTLLLEIGYTVLVWPRRTRKIWIAMICLLHAGIFLSLGLKTFSLFMIGLNVSLFWIEADPEPADA